MRSKLRVRHRAVSKQKRIAFRKEGRTLANFQIGVEMYWLGPCVASADGAVVAIRPSSKNQ